MKEMTKSTIKNLDLDIEKAKEKIKRNGGKISPWPNGRPGGVINMNTKPGLKILGAIDFLVTHKYAWMK